ncbi:hypothetical protein BCV73_17985 [Paenibacillus sp. SSG-1]|nr:hypothetical protein BCV73_17985 [Paenibacillus sp. SSG-1]
MFGRDGFYFGSNGGAWQTWGCAGKGSWYVWCSTAVFLQHADHYFGDALLGNGMQTDVVAAGSLAAPFFVHGV